MVAVVVGLGLGSAHAVAESELGQLTVSTAPAGYSISTGPNTLSGDYTIDELAALTGQSLDGISDAQRREFAAFGRTWDAADGSRLLILMFQTSSDADAASVVSGVLDSAGPAGYPTGVAGAVGRIVQAASPTRLVVWRQGRYAVQLVSVAPTAEAAEAAAKQLATDQVALLTPAAGDPGGEVESDKKGIAYLIGYAALPIGIVVAVIVTIVRNSKRESAAAAAPWLAGQQGGYIAPPPPPAPWQQDAAQAPWQQGPPPPPPPPPPA